jgi:hypothetical protein
MRNDACDIRSTSGSYGQPYVLLRAAEIRRHAEPSVGVARDGGIPAICVGAGDTDTGALVAAEDLGGWVSVLRQYRPRQHSNTYNNCGCTVRLRPAVANALVCAEPSLVPALVPPCRSVAGQLSGDPGGQPQWFSSSFQ